MTLSPAAASREMEGRLTVMVGTKLTPVRVMEQLSFPGTSVLRVTGPVPVTASVRPSPTEMVVLAGARAVNIAR